MTAGAPRPRRERAWHDPCSARSTCPHQSGTGRDRLPGQAPSSCSLAAPPPGRRHPGSRQRHRPLEPKPSRGALRPTTTKWPRTNARRPWIACVRAAFRPRAFSGAAISACAPLDSLPRPSRRIEHPGDLVEEGDYTGGALSCSGIDNGPSTFRDSTVQPTQSSSAPYSNGFDPIERLRSMERLRSVRARASRRFRQADPGERRLRLLACQRDAEPVRFAGARERTTRLTKTR